MAHKPWHATLTAQHPTFAKHTMRTHFLLHVPFHPPTFPSPSTSHVCGTLMPPKQNAHLAKGHGKLARGRRELIASLQEHHVRESALHRPISKSLGYFHHSHLVLVCVPILKELRIRFKDSERHVRWKICAEIVHGPFSNQRFDEGYILTKSNRHERSGQQDKHAFELLDITPHRPYRQNDRFLPFDVIQSFRVIHCHARHWTCGKGKLHICRQACTGSCDQKNGAEKGAGRRLQSR